MIKNFEIKIQQIKLQIIEYQFDIPLKTSVVFIAE